MTKRKSAAKKSLNLVVLAVSTIGLVSGVVLVQNRQLFGQSAKENNRDKKIFVIPGDAKKTKDGHYDLGEYTDSSGKKLQGYMFVRARDESDKEKVKGDSIGTNCYKYTYDSNGHPAKLGQGEIIYIDPSNAYALPEGTISNAVNKGMNTWEGAASQNFMNGTYTVSPSSITAGANGNRNGKNEIYFAFIFDSDPTDPHLPVKRSANVAVTSVWLNKENGAVDEFDIVLNDAYKYGDGGADSIDLQGLLTHELGHTVGLNDLYSTECCYSVGVTMCGYTTNNDTTSSTLTEMDKKAVNNLYNTNVPLGPVSSDTSSNNVTFVDTLRKFYPLSDTYVRSDYPANNYGTSAKLGIDGSPIKIIYLKFDLTALAGKTINQATLYLRVTDASVSTQNVKNVTSGWSESAITYNNRPALGGVITSFSGTVAGTWKSINLTNFIKANKGTVVALAFDSSGTDGVDFYSSDAVSYKPYLLIK